MPSKGYKPPVRASVQATVAHLDANQREWFEERAAIIEHDAKVPRGEAERQALAQTLAHFNLSPQVSCTKPRN